MKNINLLILYIAYGDGWFWFRLFGYGINGKDTNKNALLFSERNGYTKMIRIKNWRFTFLKP